MQKNELERTFMLVYFTKLGVFFYILNDEFPILDNYKIPEAFHSLYLTIEYYFNDLNKNITL